MRKNELREKANELRDKAYRLEEIKEEIWELLREAKELLRGTEAESRAKAYWIPGVLTSLTNQHSYLSRSMCCMEDTIEELYEEADGFLGEDD